MSFTNMITKKSLMAFSAASLAAVTSLTSSIAHADEQFVTIGTGGQTGIYYVVGQSICRFVNKQSSQNPIRCTAPSSAGSVANINSIRSGAFEMAVAQSDWQYNAYHGSDKFSDPAPYTDLRSLFSLYSESFTILARKDANIHNLDDLLGKRVNVGAPGSGHRGTLEVIMAEKGWTMDDFKLASELKPTEQAQAICDNKVDAGIVNGGHPIGFINEADSSCDINLANLEGTAVDKLVATYPYYSKATIPAGLYSGTPEEIKTFGVAATFVSSAKVSDDVVYAVVKAVFDNLDRFKQLHPAFANLDPQKMIQDSLSAPLHNGAIRYYKERGWM